ncbi:uncharacterized protein LOC120263667 [Dioscorea cayenensis subsp. rotundata]|uniref:Uncharacterized protein LOC120263667 n=1 Tax=Dioscorea cayennensis subsp. rotundata TaxID=55577 RepID=A0AB40BKL5_DIOCR|nr:uncharacterized protein LOC120263667 [Dioscorea cayenensis subsp. rotundata]
MERVGCGQPAPVLRKAKKKHAKDELDKQKQAEKKKRRLEKALATSAAIRSELEKKKQKKIEEQQRLEEEGAAIVEAVALHVLLGEDSDEPYQLLLNSHKDYNPWEYNSNVSLFLGCPSLGKPSVEELGWMPNTCRLDCKRNDRRSMPSLPHVMHVRDVRTPCLEETYTGSDICPGLVAAEAVSSLQIAEDSCEDPFLRNGAASVVINRMLRGSNGGNKVNFYNKF